MLEWIKTKIARWLLIVYLKYVELPRTVRQAQEFGFTVLGASIEEQSDGTLHVEILVEEPAHYTVVGANGAGQDDHANLDAATVEDINV